MAKTVPRKRSVKTSRERFQPRRTKATPVKERTFPVSDEPLAARLQNQQAALVDLAKNEAIQRGDLPRVYQTITDVVARTNEVGRASIWLYNHDRSGIVLQDLYEMETERHSAGTVLHARVFPAYFSALQREEYVIAASDAHTDPRTREFSTSYLKPLGIGAMLDAPIRHKGRILGVLCQEHVGGQRIWTKEEISFTTSLAAMVTLALDIAERTRVEEALRRSQDELEQRIEDRTVELRDSELHMRTILDTAHDAFIAIDANGIILDWNRQAEKTFGWTRGEAVGRSLANTIIPSQYREAHARGLARFLSTGSGQVFNNQRIELAALHRNGHEFPVELTVWPIRAGHTWNFNAFVRDTTERKRSEETVREERTFTDALLESLPGVVYLYDTSGRFLKWNKNFERVTGYTDDEIARMHPLEFFTGQDKERVAARIQEVFTRGVSDVEADFVAKDGTRTPYYFTGLATQVKGTRCVVGMGIDITDRKQLEDSRLAELSAERANQAKNAFLSRMSHELRTPLNAVLGYAQMLEMDPLSPKQMQRVQRILRGGRHLLALINEVLDISRIEAGRMTLSLEPVLVATVTGEAVDLIRPQAAARHIQLILPAAHGEPIYVRAEQQRLKQVVLNLLSNGVKYNREGGTLTISEQIVPENRYRMTVTDTGGGIPPELLSRLFTPFDRLTADSRIEGTGLGLVLSQNLMTAMGGTISVESRVGQGTSFTLDLPLSGPPVARAETAPSGKVEVSVPLSGKAVTVLYIEDNQSNYQLVEELVEKRPDVKLIGAMQGQLGMELAVAHRPDLILLDLNLPDIQGDEVLQRLRERSETAAIPVVMLSADAMQKQVDKLLAGGAKAYLTKPIEVEKFYALLDGLMTKKGG